jgi:hypothetical protein
MLKEGSPSHKHGGVTLRGPVHRINLLQERRGAASRRCCCRITPEQASTNRFKFNDERRGGGRREIFVAARARAPGNKSVSNDIRQRSDFYISIDEPNDFAGQNVGAAVPFFFERHLP